MQSLSRAFPLTLLSLMLLLFVGCGGGGSSGGQVAVGGGDSNGAGQPLSGSLTFQFAQSQGALTVPDATTSLRFDLYSEVDAGGTLIQSRTRGFAATIVLEDVPVGVRSVLVTAISAQGTPLATAQADVLVPPGGNLVVSLSPANTVTVVEVIVVPSSATVSVGGRRQFQAQTRLSDGNIVAASNAAWSASGAATVDSNGFATGVSIGASVITAQISGISGTATMSVVALPDPPFPLTGFRVTPTSLMLEEGGSGTLRAVGTYANGTERTLSNATDGLTYASSNSAVATADDAGSVRGVGDGQAIITARVGQFSQNVTVVVSEPPAPVTITGLLVQPQEATVIVGGTQQFTATALLSDGTTASAPQATWTSGANASVTSNGLATGLSVGAATVTAQLGVRSDSADLTVSPAPPPPVNLTGIAVAPTSVVLDIGASESLVTTGTFSNSSSRALTSVGDGLSYDSSNDLVATVDDSGQVQAVGAGTAIITATVGAFTDTMDVTVNAPNQAPVITLAGGETLIIQESPAITAIPEALVSDDQPNLSGGKMWVQIDPSGLQDLLAEMEFSAASTLGTVTQQSDTTVRIDLSAAATPSAIQAALRGITLRSTGASSDIVLFVEIDDGRGLEGQASKRFYVEGTTPLTLTVNPAAALSSTNFHDIQPAIEKVASVGAPGSVITVAAGDFFTGAPAQAGAAIYFVGDARNLRDLHLRGANHGKSAGISPVTRSMETVVRGFGIQETHNLVIDGFEIRPLENIAQPQVTSGSRADYTIANTRFTYAGASYWNYNFSNVSITFEDCSFTGPATSVEENYSQSFTCTGCTFRGSYGPFIYDTPQITFTGNGLSEARGGFGASFESFDGGQQDINVIFSGNDVMPDSSIEVLGPLDINAQNNWWGQASGPQSGQISSYGSGQALFTPFLTTDPFPSFP